MNQNEREGQSMGRTTGASGQDAKRQQDRTIEGQESQPGKVWRESDKAQYTGQGDTNVGGSGTGGTEDEPAVNEQMDESQWQGNRFNQGGGGMGTPGGTGG